MGPLLLFTQDLPSHDRTHSILVVDDDADIRDAVKTILEFGLERVRVYTADCGEAALEILRREDVDLIVSDYKMPGMNGVDFLNEALTLAPDASRILITAFSRELADDLGPQAGLESVLTKPLAPRPLIKTCKDLLARHPR